MFFKERLLIPHLGGKTHNFYLWDWKTTNDGQNSRYCRFCLSNISLPKWHSGRLLSQRVRQILFLGSCSYILSFGFFMKQKMFLFELQISILPNFETKKDAFYSSVGFFNSSVRYNCLTFLSDIILNQEIKKCKEKISYRYSG